MRRAGLHGIALGLALVASAAGCSSKFGPAQASKCCATLGYTRTQVESVLGVPAPPASSKWHPFPSPPPDAPIYTTEHGYLTVTYTDVYVGSRANPERRTIATRLSIDFYEGKAPADAFRIARAYLPPDAIDMKDEATGTKGSIRIFWSATVKRRILPSHGYFYVSCNGPQPARLCEQVEILTADR